MIYVLPIEFIVQTKEGSGMVLTVEDISNLLKTKGYKVDLVQPISPDQKIRLHVIPPRHIVTGEDVKLELKERSNAKYCPMCECFDCGCNGC